MVRLPERLLSRTIMTTSTPSPMHTHARMPSKLIRLLSGFSTSPEIPAFSSSTSRELESVSVVAAELSLASELSSDEADDSSDVVPGFVNASGEGVGDADDAGVGVGLGVEAGVGVGVGVFWGVGVGVF